MAAFWEIEYLDPEEIDDLFAMFLGLLRMKEAEDRVKARRKEKA